MNATGMAIEFYLKCLTAKIIHVPEQDIFRTGIRRKYVDYYHSCRTHLSLEKDALEPRRVESPAMGKVSAIPKVGRADAGS